MRYELAHDVYRAVESATPPGSYGVAGHLWMHKNGHWYVLYGPEYKRRVSTRTKDKAVAAEFMRRFFVTRDWLIVTRRKLA